MRKKGVKLILLAGVFLIYFIVSYNEAPDQVPPGDTPSAVAETAPDASSGSAPAPTGDENIRLVSWNLLNLGKSKEDTEVAFIADVLRDYDLVAVQEVNTGPDGAQAVARLDAELDRRGAQWDYVVSDPTSGQGSERYAYLWKPSRVRLAGRPWLEASLADVLDREPFMARFTSRSGARQVLIASLHAVPTAKRPADEIAHLDALPRRYPDDHLIILGDFNLDGRHAAFDELREAGFWAALDDQKTSIRMRRKDGEHLANEYDNIFYKAATLRADAAGVIDFTGEFRTLRQARQISDHLPVFMVVRWN